MTIDSAVVQNKQRHFEGLDGLRIVRVRGERTKPLQGQTDAVVDPSPAPLLRVKLEGNLPPFLQLHVVTEAPWRRGEGPAQLGLIKGQFVCRKPGLTEVHHFDDEMGACFPCKLTTGPQVKSEPIGFDSGRTTLAPSDALDEVVFGSLLGRALFLVVDVLYGIIACG